MKEFDPNLYIVQLICESLPFTRPEPIPDGEFADYLTGDWKDVPAWAIRRMNFYIERERRADESRCPRMWNPCPETMDSEEPLSCHTIKHCYPYLCNGSCGHNEIWVVDEEKALIAKFRREKFG